MEAWCGVVTLRPLEKHKFSKRFPEILSSALLRSHSHVLRNFFKYFGENLCWWPFRLPDSISEIRPVFFLPPHHQPLLQPPTSNSYFQHHLNIINSQDFCDKILASSYAAARIFTSLLTGSSTHQANQIWLGTGSPLSPRLPLQMPCTEPAAVASVAVR